MSTFEDYAVHREALADVLAGYADAKVPYVTDNPDVPVPFALTPAADAELDTWTGPAPDPRETAAARDAWNTPAMDPEPEPEWDAEAHPGWDIPGPPDPEREPSASYAEWLAAGEEPDPEYEADWEREWDDAESSEYVAQAEREAEAG